MAGRSVTGWVLNKAPGWPLSHAHERHLQIAQGAQLGGKHLIHGKAHDHPRNGQRVQHIFLDQQKRPAGQGDNEHMQGIAPSLTQRLGVGKDLLRRHASQGADDDLPIQPQHKHLAGTDAAALPVQGRKDRRRLALSDGTAQLFVHRQPVEAVLQASPAQVQQALEHSAAGLQLHQGLIFHGPGSGHFHGKIHRAHHDQQQQRQHPGQPRLEGVAPFHPLASWQRAHAPAQAPFCHTLPSRLAARCQINARRCRTFGKPRLVFAEQK
jgi:hypothetical protein